jgi:hypothetical protein
MRMNVRVPYFTVSMSMYSVTAFKRPLLERLIYFHHCIYADRATEAQSGTKHERSEVEVG